MRDLAAERKRLSDEWGHLELSDAGMNNMPDLAYRFPMGDKCSLEVAKGADLL